MPDPVPSRRAKALAIGNRVLPGLTALAGEAGGRTERLVGLGVLSLWALPLGLGVWRMSRIVDTLRAGGWDDWLALATLLAVPALAWLAGNRSSRRPRTGAAWWSVAVRRFRRHRQAMLGLILLGWLGFGALLAPYVAPFDPDAQGDIVATRYQAPTAAHPMGTDEFGRDVLSRVVYGARVSLSIGFLAVLIAITLGTAIGAVAGYAGGWSDAVLMRIVDLFLSFPRLVLVITVAALFEPSIELLTIVLGLTGWMGVSRVVRGQVLAVKELPYVRAARALGFGSGRIVGRHVLPNVLTPVIVAATLGIGNTILAEAALSYLGLGVQPPTASWGTIIESGKSVMIDAWWITMFPGLAIVFTVMAFNLVGDGLRDALDPRTVR
ncbi:MAG: ABC transporter permease [Gemmatimonadota bacterium]